MTREPLENPLLRALGRGEGRAERVGDHVGAGHALRPGNRDPGIGRADLRPAGPHDRRGHRVPRRDQGAAPEARARLPGEPRCAHRPHQSPRVRQSPAGAPCSARSAAKASYALLYIDLDQFKVVNDTCGHQAGDRLLRDVTGLLQTRVRASDTIARLGGDEFGVLLESCTLEQATRIAEGVRQAIRDYRFVWGATALSVGASIGVVRDQARDRERREPS